jgi:hypothetical protein
MAVAGKPPSAPNVFDRVPYVPDTAAWIGPGRTRKSWRIDWAKLITRSGRSFHSRALATRPDENRGRHTRVLPEDTADKLRHAIGKMGSAHGSLLLDRRSRT